MELKVGSILNFSGTGLYPTLIKFGTKSKWSHSAIICSKKIEDGVYYSLVYEALSKGFVANWYEDWWLAARYNEGKLAIGEVKQPLKNVKSNADKYLGTPYSWYDILTIVKYIYTGKDSKETSNLICSEAVAKIVYDCTKSVDFSKEFKKHYSLITPQDLFASKQIRWSFK